jgi:hypothetical protein
MATYAWPRLNRENRLIDRHHCTWADVDRNGRPDAYCTTGRTLANIVKRGRGNELWIQQRDDGHLAERSTRWHVGDVCGRGRVAEFVNANGDEFPDLVTSNARPRTDDHDECDTSPTLPNEKSKLFINVLGKDFQSSRHRSTSVLFRPVATGGRWPWVTSTGTASAMCTA